MKIIEILLFLITSCVFAFSQIVVSPAFHSVQYQDVENPTNPCPDMPEFMDFRDSTIYKTVQIGEQCWMAENLRFLNVPSPSSEGSDNTPLYYVYDYQGNNFDDAVLKDNYFKYGVLYNWAAAMAGEASSSNNPSGVQGVCPDGWHLPSNAEWNQLAFYIGDDLNVNGAKLKEVGTNNWKHPNAGANNQFVFSGLPGGYRTQMGHFSRLRERAYFWSSTDFGNIAYNKRLNFEDEVFYTDIYNYEAGFSVRCVRNPDCELPTKPLEGNHQINHHQIIWNWSDVANADGYKYNTVPNYNTAIDNGLSTSFIQTNLNCDSIHYLHVWAYNECGDSDVLNISKRTDLRTIISMECSNERKYRRTCPGTLSSRLENS